MKRLWSTLRTDVRLQWRHGFYYAVLVVTIIAVLLGRQLTGESLATLMPLVVVNNLIINGFYFVAGLVLLEKGEGTLEAQVVTPLRAGEYLISKTLTLGLLSLLETAVLVLLTYGWPPRPLALVAGVLLGTAFYTLAGFIVVARYDSINEYLLPSVPYAALLALPLLPYAGIGNDLLVQLAFLHPLQPVLVFLESALQPVGNIWRPAFALLYGSLWLGLFFWLSLRSFHRFVVRKEGVRQR
ncbi:MAG: ABC transporter permease [Candidatus Promineifilaceae bacterium]|nr:ABC transporter permease [Candidatus Promineifilaceae bacterium]